MGQSHGAHRDDPFSPPHAADPAVLVGRGAELAALTHLNGRLVAGRFASGLVFTGCRGVGKSVIVRRAVEMAREAHAIVISLDVRPAGPSLEDQVVDAIRNAISSESGRREWRLRKSSSGRAVAKGRVPMTPIEFELERALDGSTVTLDRALERLFGVMDDHGVPALLAIDEADAMSADFAEVSLVQPLGRAASADLPLSALIAGTSRSVVRAAGGLSTFGPGLLGPRQMARLDRSESREVLVATALTADEDWSEFDLDAIVDAAVGIPRFLQAAGGHLYFAIQTGLAPRQSVELAAEKVQQQRRSLRMHLFDHDRRVLRAVEDRLTGHPADMDDLVADLAADGIVESLDRGMDAMLVLEELGALEVTHDGLLSMVLI